MYKDFLPINKDSMKERNWNQVDVIFISGDAYVDHPSFATGLLSRLLESKGYNVGIISQPRWNTTEDFLALGQPRLCCMISSGNLDSMVAHYTSTKKKRSQDMYSPGGKAGLRPDRALITYCSKAKQVFKGVPIIIGGLEGSLRRLAHYDYWSDTVRRSILLDSKADLLVYGMGERQTVEIVDRLNNGEDIKKLNDIRGTVWHNSKPIPSWPVVDIPSYEETSLRDKKNNIPLEEGKQKYAEAFSLSITHENPMNPECLIQKSGNTCVIQNPPALPLSEKEFDSLFEFPYTRNYHPIYKEMGGIPGLKEVQFSITSNRGCFGACSFCAISSHQGRIIQTRSKDSLIREATTISKHPEFKGYIHDLGGPTANFQGIACNKQKDKGPCSNRQCLFPKPCPNLKDSHLRYIEILQAIRKIPNVKKVFIRSGIRFDYLMLIPDEKTRNLFIKELVENHVSGQLKIAPEHTDNKVLSCMGKLDISLYKKFKEEFILANKKANKRQYLIPYFIAAHPGSTLDSAIDLALFLKKDGFIPNQVQEFYPTPGTVSTCMYYTGIDPRPGKNFEKVYIPKGREANLQRALLQFNKKNNRHLVIEALKKANRLNLIDILR